MPPMMRKLSQPLPAEYPPSWYAHSAPLLAPFAPLEGDVDTDVCVIGGGYTGLSTAIHLRKRGYDVVLLEAERIGWGASGRNGGHVGTGQRADQERIEQWVGLDAAKALWQLSLEAVDRVCELIDEYDIDCELGVGNLHLAAKPSHAQDLQAEREHLETVYGYEGLTYLSPKEAAALTSAQGIHGALLDTGCRHLHPLKYALGLARAASKLGVRIYEGTRGQPLPNGRSGTVKTDQGCVRAKQVVLGCNAYLGTIAPRLAGNIMPINNFVIATEPLPAELLSRINRDNVSMSDTCRDHYWKCQQMVVYYLVAVKIIRVDFPPISNRLFAPICLKSIRNYAISKLITAGVVQWASH